MIEVEIKCKPTLEQEIALLQGATFLGEEHLIDVYYDSAQYELSVRDHWLRTRNGKFVLKIPAATCKLLEVQANTPKHEIEDEQEIRKVLKLSEQGSLEQSLMTAGYHPLYTLAKRRKKYSKNGFIIDIDHSTFGSLTFDLCEIETLIEKPEDVNYAMQKLIEFAEAHGIILEPVLGSLIALIKSINPEHFEIMEKARAIRVKN
ncbi:MAG: CYTH domain-containing protein [bacterium]